MSHTTFIIVLNGLVLVAPFLRYTLPVSIYPTVVCTPKTRLHSDSMQLYRQAVPYKSPPNRCTKSSLCYLMLHAKQMGD
jgi:hypothetical protein